MKFGEQPNVPMSQEVLKSNESKQSAELMAELVENESDNKIEGDRKYRVMTSEDVDSCKEWAKSRIVDLYKIKPKVVFLNETSATPLGWLLKEAWKSCYSSDELPNFFRIDPRASVSRGNVHVRGQYDPQKWKALQDFIDKRIVDKMNDKVVVVDENPDSGGSLRRVRDFLTKVGGVNSENITFFPDISDPNFRDYSQPKNFDYAGSRYIKPTIKRVDSNQINLSDFGYNFRARIIKNPELIKKSLDYIHDLKLAGREAGNELKEDKK